MQAGGLAIAAIVAELLALPERPRGTLMIDEVVKLAPVLDRMRTLGGAEAIVLHVMR
jgi:hypothetical protein